MNRIKLFLVDADPVFLRSMEMEFSNLGNYEIETYLSGKQLLAHLYKKPDVIILDCYVDASNHKDISGLEILKQIKKADETIHVIMLSSQDKIEVALKCVNYNAFDYFAKNETTFFRLKKAINTVLYLHKIQKELNWYMDRM